MADALDSANEAPYEVEQMKIRDHRVKVQKNLSGRESAGEYTIVGITTGEFSGGSR